MKRYTNLYARICDMDNLCLAHLNAKKGKAHYSEVRMVDSNPDKYLTQIQAMLLTKSYWGGRSR